MVINAATNDVAENTHPYVEDMTVDNISSLIELAQANGITPVLTTTLPAASFGWRKEITGSSDKIAALNKRLEAPRQRKGHPVCRLLLAPCQSRRRDPCSQPCLYQRRRASHRSRICGDGINNPPCATELAREISHHPRDSQWGIAARMRWLQMSLSFQ